MIRFENVTKSFPDGTTAVDGLDLVIADNQITVLVGASGCGKTTSLRMINRMVDPTSGRVLIDDRDIRESDPQTLRRTIGYVIQQGGLFPHRTVADNIATVPLLLGTSRGQARSRALELLELVGLPTTFATRYPHQLSGGQQQRVGVARALAADPPILLMDEPFSAVDPVVRGSLQSELLKLQAELRKTIVFVTHDIAEAIVLGDKIGVMRVGGHLVQYDTPQHLLAHPVDDYVTDFLGTDRGIRLLSFVPSTSLVVQSPEVIATDTPTEQARSLPGDWLLKVDGDGRPVGWLARRDLPGTELIGDSMSAAIGRVFRPGADPLRAALDSVTLSPAGLAVAVEADGRLRGTVSHADIAVAISKGNGPGMNWQWVGDHLGLFADLLAEHVYLSVVPVIYGLIISIPLGVACTRWTRLYPPVLATTSILYALPSIALFVFLLDYTGLSSATVIIPLTIYTLSVLVRNVVDGLRSVSDSVRQSAVAMGFGPVRRLLQVELPIAVPIVIAGVRIATVANISLVSVGSLVGIGGLGQLFTDGFQRGFITPIVVGIVLTILLAVTADGLLVLSQRLLTPWARA